MFRVIRVEDQFEMYCDVIVCDPRCIHLIIVEDGRCVQISKLERSKVRVTTHSDSCSPNEHLECHEGSVS